MTGNAGRVLRPDHFADRLTSVSLDELAAAGVDSHRSFANVRDPRNKETGYAQQDAKGGAESGGLQHPLTAGPESPWAAW